MGAYVTSSVCKDLTANIHPGLSRRVSPGDAFRCCLPGPDDSRCRHILLFTHIRLVRFHVE
jgi:hypothetical protein